ncbi:hypothetical protein EFN46_11310 [Leuconostoc pseudomesenteroides]|uniref:hypothetical protein n=1 Tax=Leuconostoc pseudomesenteroides TaxID=33968 RepID=UPI0021AACF0F|nr:hypothetical protein [Leuconostoc pseudomesenteroides]MCT4388773.1 hypothetical protein [Leuconostoc pseudomesenteroides]
MKEGTFTFNGVNSEQFGVYVSSTPARVPPQSVWAVGNPSNRNGSVYRNLGVFTNSCSYTKKMDYFYSVRKMKV